MNHDTAIAGLRQRSEAGPGQRLPFASMSVALGLGGLGAAWTAAAARYGLPAPVGEILSAISLTFWLVVTVARFPFSRRRWILTREELRHPFAGPFPTYVPVVGLLLTSHYASAIPLPLSQGIALVLSAVLTAMCGYLMSWWLSGGVRLTDLHPGYLLPIVAGPFLASTTLTAVGLTTAALAAIGAGVFFWLTLGTIITGRLMGGGRLPKEQLPVMSVLLTPPLTGGAAWFAAGDGRADLLQQAVLGIVAILLVAQLFLLPLYLSTPWSPSWWALAFPAAALAGYALRWDGAIGTVTTRGIAIAALTLATTTMLILVTRAILAAVHRHTTARRS